jgi:membrane protease YdiL (CAAX protease family)
MNQIHELIGAAGVFHLLFFGLVIPVFAIKSGQRLKTAHYPPRVKHFISVIVQLAFFAVISVWVARAEHIPVWNMPRQLLWSLFAGFILLSGALGFVFPRIKKNVAERERKLYLFMPRTGLDRILWIVISALAGFSEEITYRGVMFSLLAELFANSYLAALCAAIVFAVSHALQGWRSVIAILIFALAFHALVFISGSLLIAMVVHFLYDLIAGLAYGHYGERLGYPLEPIAPAELAGESAST